MVLEHEVVNAVADKRCYSGADSNVSKKKLAMSNSNNNRESLDREPAAPGEQVRILEFVLLFQVSTILEQALLTIQNLLDALAHSLAHFIPSHPIRSFSYLSLPGGGEGKVQ